MAFAKFTAAVLLLTGLAAAQPNPIGRELTATAGGATVGTPCQTVTTCTVSSLNVAMGSTVRFTIRGGIGQAWVLSASPPPLFCSPGMAILGQNLLASPTVVAAGIMLASPGPCPGIGTVSFPVGSPVGTVALLQALVGTTSGAIAYTDRVQITVI
ncbi:MAG: hypothetical protein AAF628_18010 [Planctomycetota bacterium]